MKNRKYHIAFIGAGNVAFHLAAALNKAGHTIDQVISRSALSAQTLANIYDAKFNTRISSLKNNIDILFLTVPDHVIPELVKNISAFKGMVFHTSGTVPISIFSNAKYSHGVFYPLQTFSKNREVNFKDVPVFVESTDPRVLSVLLNIGKELSTRVSELESDKRAHLHLAAVFANNFTNYLLTASHDILNEAGLDKEVLNSLLRETLEKAITQGPGNSQTGPAVRGDSPTIKKHLDLLSFSPELKHIYQCMTKSIQSYFSVESEKNNL